MPKLVFEFYWEKTEDIQDSAFKKVLKGDYELKSREEYPDDRTQKQFNKDCRSKYTNSYLGEVRPGVFKYNVGTHYGINSYKLIYLRGLA